jgi:hypothetical protein
LPRCGCGKSSHLVLGARSEDPLIINGPAYGSDETFNAIRLAIALAKRDDVQPRMFLMATL